MTVRKSQPPEKGLLDQHLALITSPALRAATDRVVEDLAAMGIEDAPALELPVDAVDYHLAITVEVAQAESVDGLSLAELLAATFGGFVNEASKSKLEKEAGGPISADALLGELGLVGDKAVKAALKAYYRVREAVEREEYRLGRRVRPVPDLPLDLYLAQTRERLRRSPIRTDLDTSGILRYSANRARELGFSAAELWAKQQGARGGRHQRVKRARALIVVELRERGAGRTDIGRVFGGRRRESIYEIEKLGRAIRAEERKEGHGA